MLLEQKRERKTYPSDITREQFEQIRLDLEGFKKRTKPRRVDLYDIFCGVLYVLKSGCQWRMLPDDLPKWRTVNEYYYQWSKKSKEEAPSLLEEILKKLVGEERLKLGRNYTSSFLIVDAQSVK